MDLPHPATSEDRERKSAAGRTATSCPICDTPSGVSGGHRAVFKVSIISSMVTPPVACTTLLTRTKPWGEPCPGRSSRWTPSAGGIGGPPPASRTNASAPSCSASTRPAGTVWHTDRPPKDPPAAMDNTVWMVDALPNMRT